MNLRRPLTATLIAAAAVAVPTLGTGFAEATAEKGPEAQAAVKRIAVKDDFFKPRRSRAPRGKVTFRWRGNGFHNVVFRAAPGRNPRACGLRSGGRCTRRLKRRGVYRFVCTIHSGMRGRIRVR
jgi:plastocyanin